MVPPNLVKTISKKTIKEKELVNPAEELEDEPEYEEEVEEIEDSAIPSDNPEQYQKPVNKQDIELQLELKLRKLADVETQLKTKRISIKNDSSLAGIMTENEMLSIASTLKYEINNIIDFMKANFTYEDKWFVDKFVEAEKGLKGYEYWVITSKK